MDLAGCLPGCSFLAAVPEMLSYTKSVTIGACPGAIWACLVDFDHWWAGAHPGHLRVEIPSGSRRVVTGTEIHFEERVAGLKAVTVGWIVSLHPEVELTWEGVGDFRFLGVRIAARTGIRWQLLRMGGEVTMVTTSMWAEVASGWRGELLEWAAEKLLRMVERGGKHLRGELHSLKDLAEGNGGRPVQVRQGRGKLGEQKSGQGKSGAEDSGLVTLGLF